MKIAEQKAEKFWSEIAERMRRPAALMEVCGTHTMAIGRFGLRRRLPAGLRLISGPGCPVCVTPAEQIDLLCNMAAQPGVAVATFGDMLRVPGSRSSLIKERAAGRDVRVVYSAFDALQMALAEPKRLVVFMGVGFETTSPTVAATVLRAAELSCHNFLVLPAFKLVPPAMLALLSEKTTIDGFICPGHVSAVIGSTPYRPVAEKGAPCVVTGFEALDILEGISMLLAQLAEKRSEVEVQYRRAVPENGNPEALGLLEKVFTRSDSRWRGIGTIPGSGLEFSPQFSSFDARGRLGMPDSAAADLPPGCCCGEVMRGRILPNDCPLFASACTPARPVGPCMVSSEGACAAYFRYGG